MRRLALNLSVLSVLVGGCANPVLRIDAPGYSLARSEAPKGEPQTMAEAQQKLNHLRASYYEAIMAQAGMAQDTTTGLVWLGTLVAGMAAGSVHRDAILGASLIGGTTYGLSRSQLDVRRIQIWTEGMKALDCAREAAQPLDIGAAWRTELKAARVALSQQRGQVVSARARVKAELDLLDRIDDADTQRARSTLALVDAALTETDQSQAAALALLRASRGDALSSTVDRIHTRVTEAMGSILVDVASVKQMVAGLGGFAGVFAPGAGLEGALEKGFKKQADKFGAQSAATAALNQAVDALQADARLLAVQQRQVAGLLKDVDQGAVAAALKKCDVAGVATPIMLLPAGLSFTEKATATKGFGISGGTPPYVVTLLDAAPDGLSLLFSGGFADTVQVKVTDAVKADSYRVLVSDSGSVRRQAQLVVAVAAAASAPAAPKADEKSGAPGSSLGAPGASEVQKDWDALAKAMTAPGFRKTLGSASFSVAAAQRAGDKLAITLQCSPAAAGLSAADVRDLLATADKAAVKRLITAKVLDPDFRQFDLGPSAACIKP